MTALHECGYRVARVSASGQRKGARIEEECLAGDIIALSTVYSLPHLLVEVGGEKKVVCRALDELRGSLLPGFAPLVVRFIGRKRRFNVDEDAGFDTLEEALEAIKQ